MRTHYESQPETYYAADRFFRHKGFFSPISDDARILNLGCGRGEALKKFTKGIGIDFNRNLRSVWQRIGVSDRCFILDATNLPYQEHEFDWTISTDFLEHVQPETIEPIVRNIFRLAPHGKHVISLAKQSKYRGPEGENLHLSANDAGFWMRQFSKYRPLPAFHKKKNCLTVTW